MTPDKEELKLHETMDANDWAKEFLRCVVFENHPIDLDTMRAWFANSIMCGYDHHGYKAQKELSKRDAIIKMAAEALENRVHCLACQTHEHPATKRALSEIERLKKGNKND